MILGYLWRKISTRTNKYNARETDWNGLVQTAAFKHPHRRLIKYFLACLTFRKKIEKDTICGRRKHLKLQDFLFAKRSQGKHTYSDTTLYEPFFFVLRLSFVKSILLLLCTSMSLLKCRHLPVLSCFQKRILSQTNHRLIQYKAALFWNTAGDFLMLNQMILSFTTWYLKHLCNLQPAHVSYKA